MEELNVELVKQAAEAELKGDILDACRAAKKDFEANRNRWRGDRDFRVIQSGQEEA